MKLETGLDGKVAVVTGGTGVLGQAMCRALAQYGVNVVILARTESDTKELAEEIGGMGIAADVLKKDTLQAAADKIISEWGHIDILINGAGGNRSDATAGVDQSFFDIPQEAAEWVFNLNFMGSFLTSQVFGQHMVNQQSGVILNVSSMASLQPLTRVIAYSAAKAAINNFTQWLAVYLAQNVASSLRVNAIAPGFFLTEQNRYLLTNKETGDLTERGQQILNHTPMARFGEPEDLVGTMLWLVSDASKFVTGIVVPVDGGFSAFSGV
jgi:NAD(P)-dependent dehydrogenase (short-subunit alcohol dehydrogenase family)